MITVRRPIAFTLQARGRKRISRPKPDAVTAEPGQIPRISRLMALAIHFDKMLRSGEVADLDELAAICHVTQPRISQVYGLSLLAPDIQEELLFLPRVTKGKVLIHEHMLRPIVAEVDWARQRKMWKKERARCAE
jgi:hypothetical protein